MWFSCDFCRVSLITKHYKYHVMRLNNMDDYYLYNVYYLYNGKDLKTSIQIHLTSSYMLPDRYRYILFPILLLMFNCLCTRNAINGTCDILWYDKLVIIQNRNSVELEHTFKQCIPNKEINNVFRFNGRINCMSIFNVLNDVLEYNKECSINRLL